MLCPFETQSGVVGRLSKRALTTQPASGHSVPYNMRARCRRYSASERALHSPTVSCKLAVGLQQERKSQGVNGMGKKRGSDVLQTSGDLRSCCRPTANLQ